MKLREVARINYGFTASASDKPVGPKFLRITDIQNNLVDWDKVPFCKIDYEEISKHKLVAGDIVFARTGATTGKSFLIKSPPAAVFASYLIRLRISTAIELLPEFLYLFFQTNEYWRNIKIGMIGSAQGGFNASKLAGLLVPLPPLHEQQRIIAILDQAFAAIAKAKENAEKNLKNAREVFESYLNSVFANPGEDWEVKRLGEVSHKTETINPILIPDKDFIYVDVSSVSNKTFKIANASLIKGKDAPSRARKLIKTGDIIFATVRPTLRRIALIPERFNNQVCSTGFFVLRAKEEIYNMLMFYFLQTNSFNDAMKLLQKGASYPAVTDGEVKEQIIKYPKSMHAQHSIVLKLKELSAETNKLETITQQKLTDLEELKKSTLQKAFNGELNTALS